MSASWVSRRGGSGAWVIRVERVRDQSDKATAWVIKVERVRDQSESERPAGVRE